MPQDYPFKAPIILLETKNDQLDAKDLIAIKKNLNDAINPWHPARKVNDMIIMANAKIKAYEEEKIASQLIANGYERTLAQLKEKYQPYDLTLGGKYPEFQKQLNGLWIKETSTGYVVFHVEGDYTYGV